ncbi:biliverdin-producing heme oxygenase [Pseudomonas sp. DWP3-1-2]|uniref:biliverdin-producing heme oxygenase n=1 Tax=Pseudomonas sp. DWP3-1-2 TaxID=2804645 RepID=UPI003CE69133
MHQELREATAVAHRSLEKRLPFISVHLDRRLYQRLLEAYYGFYYSIERQLDQVPNLQSANLDGRRKAPVLARDLHALGLPPEGIATLALCTDLPAVENNLQALGVMYVMEGATLGGQVLSRVVQGKLLIGTDSGGAFLDVYGGAADQMWKDVLALLSHVVEPSQRAQVIHSARLTFSSFERWLERSEVLR